MNFKESTKRWIKIIDEELNRLLVKQEETPNIIHEAMRYSVFAGGKRLRPILCLAASGIFGEKPENTIKTACALEIIHTYSLIHDDHPDLDNDSLRRGLPTNHVVYGNAMAILAGDALLTKAFEILSEEALHEKDPCKLKNRLQANYEIVCAVNSTGMIGGQVMDIVSESSKTKDSEILRYIHTHKTGDLIRASVRSGALIAGAEKDDLANLTVYAEKIGMAFQITDDILDIEGQEDVLGKNIGSDEKNEKLTYPSIYGLEQSKQMATDAVDEAIVSLEKTGKDILYLRELAEYILARNK